mgnify:CR=1 FL=1
MNEALPEIQKFHFPEGKDIPNHPHLPTLIYRQVKKPGTTDLASWWNQTLHRNNWKGLWRGSVFDYHHFHPRSHEFLGIARGQATLQLGGQEGETVEVQPGDGILIPAGVGHKKVESSRGFQVIGGYPSGQENPEIFRQLSIISDAIRSGIKATSLPEKDPVFGNSGSLFQYWKDI